MFGKIAFGRRHPFGADGGKAPRVVRDHQRLARRMGPALRPHDDFANRAALGDTQENPASLVAALDHAGVHKNTHMPRHARLALVEHDRQFADRQLHLAQQGDDSQPRRIRQGAENVEELSHEATYKAFFISGQWNTEPCFLPLATAKPNSSRRFAEERGKKAVAPILPRL